MRPARLKPVAAALTALLALASHPARAQSPTECFGELARLLSADTMEGRGVGTEGLERAADVIAARLEESGLEVQSQPFEVATGFTFGAQNWLVAGDIAYALEADFRPAAFSSSAPFEGPLVFGGYGIQAEPLGYDDYAGLDLTGRVVLALRHEPGEADEASPFDGRRPTRWSELRYKAHLAREAGAAALILVEAPSPEGQASAPDALPPSRGHSGVLSSAGLPVLEVTWAVAAQWAAAAGYDLAELQRAIDASYSPHSRVLEGVVITGRTDVVPTLQPVRNVIGVLGGRGELVDEVVVVGAHYDHLGAGGSGSRAPDSTAIHNGADDNASGVAAVVCAMPQVRAFWEAFRGDMRTLVVIAFTAEELGLGGSGFYVDHPLYPLDGTIAMINLDMVGRVRDGQLSALGTDSSLAWPELLEEAARPVELILEMGGDGYGPSDQTSFYELEIPVVHFFSGAHDEYHTPADDFETLNVAGGGQVTELLGGLLTALVTRPERPAFVASTSGPTMGGDSRGYGAYLGSIPDYSAMLGGEGGVLLSGVRAGGPADAAGLLAGDTIVAFADRTIDNLYDLTYALQDHRPGETVVIEVEREGARVTVEATLGSRAAPSEGGENPHAHESGWVPAAGEDASALLDAREVHLTDLRQLTFGGENAEAYFAPDGRRLIFQRTPPEGGCDQEFVLDLDSGEVTQVSSGRGRTTCGYFAYPEGERLLYATTEHVAAECPAPPDRSAGYVWALYDYDLVWQDGPRAAPVPFLPSSGYDAEATACMRDGRIVFTSTRDGDLELYSVAPDGSDLRRLTHTPGYDGGAFYTRDCATLVWRASRPEGAELEAYRALLERGLVQPGELELFAADADGANVRQLTDNGAANFGPYPLPDASGVIFSSNVGGSPREFDLYVVPMAGGELEQVTFIEEFDGFPMFSPDGRWLVFASNRGATDNQTNLFIARWVP